MTANTLPAPFAPYPPTFVEQLSVLAAVAALGLVWWMGVRAAPAPAPTPACAAADRVSYAQVDAAARRLAAAHAAVAAAAGDPLTVARVGLTAEQRSAADAARREQDAAGAAWLELCGS